ncbi:hypothetical protein ACIRVF_24730 [Kitasatospora sp. NPDC101157]|uniref:hypothetical protein n=1 Tax=Kitasatospora sp. NPDC101157 TaxID=3364098 RepID=UPI0037F8BA1C
MINLQVRDDGGGVVARAGAGVQWTAAFAELDPTLFPMLFALTPCGDAVFNRRQLPLLLAELDWLPDACGGEWVEQARALCGVVERAPHRYLWFVGD